MKRVASVFVLFALVAPLPARADDSVRLSFGTGVAARSAGGDTGPALPLELTLTMVPIVSISTGAVFSDVGLAHAYFEFAVWFGVSVGVGGGYGAYASPAGRKDGGDFHLFVGLPIPLGDPAGVIDSQWFFYVLPYYRPSWGPWPGTAHEGGMMLKVSYAIVRGRIKFGG